MTRLRDKETTQKKILQAFERLVARDGLHQVGLNAVAREAGVDKVLVYRYFGGVPQLLSALAARHPLWPTFEEVIGTNTLGAADLSAEELAFRFLSGIVRELRKRPLSLAVLRAEIVEKNPLTIELSRAREKWAEDMLEYLESAGVCAEAIAPIAAILSAGLVHLLLSPALADAFGGVDLKHEDSWKKMDDVVRQIVRTLILPPHERGT
jgi:AcrR family transcriptional regulator